MKWLQISIPKDLHKAFKQYCLDKDMTMKQVIIKIIKKILDKNNDR